jgi:hypothetical protein
MNVVETLLLRQQRIAFFSLVSVAARARSKTLVPVNSTVSILPPGNPF